MIGKSIVKEIIMCVTVINKNFNKNPVGYCETVANLTESLINFQHTQVKIASVGAVFRIRRFERLSFTAN
jgi:hypothetical protein